MAPNDNTRKFMMDVCHYPLLAHNTFHIDVYARRFVEYGSVGELQRFLATAAPGELAHLLHIGGGSNLLFTSDFEGIILHSGIRGREIVGEDAGTVTVRVGAAEVWDDLVAYAVGQGWYGAENLSLIPGEVGASAVQNIGAYGVEAKDLIRQVETVRVATGEVKTFEVADCGYAYRSSVFKGSLKGQYIVTHVIYRFSKEPSFRLEYGNIRAVLEQEGGVPTLQRVRDCIIRIRREKLPDPQVTGNAGSFFMNPVLTERQFGRLLQDWPDMPHYPAGEGMVKVPAGWLIDRCGWKGKSMGKAGVHDRQALVLVNRGGACGADIVRLAEAIVESVRQRFGISLQPEVNYVGHGLKE